MHELYESNPFVSLLQMKITQLETDMIELSMPITSNHTNLYDTVHGGALASLADTAMGMACSLTGKKVVTLEMNLNFVRAAGRRKSLHAIGRVLHNGRQTLVAEAEIFDNENKLVTKARGTFFVVGQWD